MANLRPMLFMGLIVLSYLMWIEWQKDYGSKPAPATTSTNPAFDNTAVPGPQALDSSIPSSANLPSGDLPSADSAIPSVNQGNNSDAGQQATMRGASELLTVKTDLLEVGIDLTGGTVVSAKLLNYPVDLEAPEIKVDLFSRAGPDMYIAQSGLLSGAAAPNHTSPYQSASMSYTLDQNADEIRVPLTWDDGSGIHVTKTFIFKRGKYDVDVRHTLTNGGNETWSGSRYDQLQRSVPADQDDGGFTNPGRYSFFGIGFYSPEEKFEKVDFDDIADDPFNRSFKDGWLSMVQHYFFAAWIPPAEVVSSYSTQVYSPAGFPRYIARVVSPSVDVNAGTSHEFEGRLYMGPKLQDELADVAPGLAHTVNYGIFTVFSKPLFWLLSKIHSFTNNGLKNSRLAMATTGSV